MTSGVLSLWDRWVTNATGITRRQRQNWTSLPSISRDYWQMSPPSPVTDMARQRRQSSEGHNISWNFDTNGQLKVAFTIRVYYFPTNAQVIVLKSILKFTLKQLRHVSGRSHRLQGARYPCLLKLHFLKIVNYGSSVVMWLHVLVVSLFMCVCRLHHVRCFMCGAGGASSCIQCLQASAEGGHCPLVSLSVAEHHSNWLTSRGRFHIDKLIVPQLTKVISTFHEKWKFTAVFTTSHHFSRS
jgi:hypothetical protein